MRDDVTARLPTRLVRRGDRRRLSDASRPGNPWPALPERLPVFPRWVPGDRVLTAGLVILVAVAAAFAPHDGADHAATTILRPSDAAAPLSTTQTAPVAIPSTATVSGPAPAATAPASGAAETAGALLPTYRILTYYGQPHDENMGILGEYSIEELHQRLVEEAANYEAADPSRPVLPAFEIIATVAQGDPGADGTYILDTDLETLTEYADFAAANNLLLFLDLQIGRDTVKAEIDKVRPLLERPNVHLALDPEFAIAEGETPGQAIGSLDAADITFTQKALAAIVAEHGLPPKVLLVHQFLEEMIVGKDRLAPVPGVQLVIDADGYGAPQVKADVYDLLVRDQPIQFGGVKLFYKQDDPLLTPSETLALNPAPDVVIYQ
jgi:hypothetical protein